MGARKVAWLARTDRVRGVGDVAGEVGHRRASCGWSGTSAARSVAAPSWWANSAVPSVTAGPRVGKAANSRTRVTTPETRAEAARRLFTSSAVTSPSDDHDGDEVHGVPQLSGARRGVGGEAVDVFAVFAEVGDADAFAVAAESGEVGDAGGGVGVLLPEWAGVGAVEHLQRVRGDAEGDAQRELVSGVPAADRGGLEPLGEHQDPEAGLAALG